MENAEQKRRYAVFIEWNYLGTCETQYERCTISIATPKDDENDGTTFVGSRGAWGTHFFIADSIEQAIIGSRFNPFAIDFQGLNDEETKAKNELLSRCVWTPKRR